jgi:hypothetical protein
MKRILLSEVQRILDLGGRVQYNWCIGEAYANYPHHLVFDKVLDGRTYQGFLNTLAPKLKQTRTGSTETKDLVITWTK